MREDEKGSVMRGTAERESPMEEIIVEVKSGGEYLPGFQMSDIKKEGKQRRQL